MVTRMKPAVSNGRVGVCVVQDRENYWGAGDLGGRLEGGRAREDGGNTGKSRMQDEGLEPRAPVSRKFL